MTQTIAALIIFLFPLAYSPGPGNMFFAAQGARFGLGATWRALGGYHLATLVVTLLIGVGFAGAQAQMPQAMMVLRWIGAGYVLWLGWQLFRAGVMAEGAAAEQAAGFGGGAMLLLLNPKAYVIIALMFSQFLVDDAGLGVGMIALVFTANNLLAFALWAGFGDVIAVRFRSEGSARMLNRVFGVVLAGVAVWMVLG